MGRRVRYEYVLPGPKRARVDAASTEAIQRLLREVRAGDASQTECAVCLQDYAAEETIRAMPVCAHAFHRHCISEWLSRNAVCPICRCELPLPTHQDQEQEEEDDEEDEHGVRRSWNWRRVPVSAAAGRSW
ncbi:unnamed protein product [Miscanthus lutarioriparius]|uniref:RING-type domain-containing protein n=1 Tax=Miscanthus lutarioriparius TaxID=422564 RepID=A0A811RLF9_9POAL|nr:unnamed protein product [Miscanthus lutarioriparius]